MRLRDFASIAAFFSDREIDDLQAGIDARREARAGRPDDPSAQERRPSRDPTTPARIVAAEAECNGLGFPSRPTLRESTHEGGRDGQGEG